MSSIEQQVAINRDWINSVIAASKLASELTESLEITNSDQSVNIQEGTSDATFVKVPIIRGSLGSYNPVTNIPTLADGTGVAGDNYSISVEGIINLGSGNITFLVDDFVSYNGSKWIKTTKSQISDILNLRTELDNINNRTLSVTVNGNFFTLRKSPGNTLTSLQIDDMILIGFWDTTEFISLAIYLGGDKDTKTSYNILESTTGL